MEEDVKIIKCVVCVDSIYFPKTSNGKYARKVDSGEFSIFTANIEEKLENCEDLNDKIKLKGTVCELNTHGDLYKVTCKLADSHPKYGDTYEIICMNKKIDLADKSKQHNFLMSILPENTVNALYEKYDDVISLLDTKNMEALCAVKGIKGATALRLIQKYEDCKDYGNFYAELGFLGLSTKLIKKLVEYYKSPDTVVETIKTNPFDLVRVDGIGFRKADEIAEKVGISGSNPNRVKGCMIYILSTAGEQGRSYIHYSDLLTQLNSTIGYIEQDVINKVCQDLIANKEVYLSNNCEQVGLSQYRKLEEDIATELIRINASKPIVTIDNIEESIESTEESQGYKFTDEQHNSVIEFDRNNLLAITGGAGCVDCDTEFFNGIEWKKVSDYTDNDKILQYDENGTATLVDALEYIKLPSNSLWHFETKYGLDQCLSDEHRVVYETSKGNLNIKSFAEVKQMHEKSSKGFYGKFYTTFNYTGAGIELSEFEIRLMCAIICDGSFSNKYNDKSICRMNIKKERKKERLELILNSLGLHYEKEQYNPNDLQYSSYLFKAPRIEKEFSSYWYNCNNEQFKIICDEILNWDGCTTKGRTTFSQINKKTIDFLQFAFATQNKRASIISYDRTGDVYTVNDKHYIRKSKEYVLSISDMTKVSMGGFHKNNINKTKIEECKTLDGYKYCFRVPSTMLVLRRNGKIFITGNCGKTTIMKAMANAVKDKYMCIGCSLSGKASVRFKEGTGLESMTIHRLLGYGFDGFIYNEKNKMPYDVIFMDEATMTSGELFLSFLKAVKDGAKLVLAGDIQQLTPIGSCQVFADILNSNILATIKLTKPHRQALRSGIIPLSMNIIRQQPIFDYSSEGIQVLGELQDMVLDIFSDDVAPEQRVLRHYLNYYNNGESINDIQIIVPCTNRGSMCTYKLNLLIQSAINPIQEDRKNMIIHLDKDREYVVQIGDKVINTKNNYNSINDDGKICPVFNGNMGVVRDINDGKMTIEFEGIGTVIFNSGDCKAIELAYACTVHKCQGSQFKNVIFAINTSDFKMLFAELGYTGITRASKHCTFVVNKRAYRTMMANRETNKKQTYLIEILQSQLLK